MLLNTHVMHTSLEAVNGDRIMLTMEIDTQMDLIDYIMPTPPSQLEKSKNCRQEKENRTFEVIRVILELTFFFFKRLESLCSKLWGGAIQNLLGDNIQPKRFGGQIYSYYVQKAGYLARENCYRV